MPREQIAEHVRHLVDQAPPLTAETRARLAQLLSAARPVADRKEAA